MGDQQDDGGGLTMNNLLSEVQNTLDKFKLEDDGPPGGDYYSPYANLEKAAVLQEARCFHDPTAVRENPRKCCTVIAQLLHLTNTGQYLNSAEATEVFFGVTKLFMSDDASLRRMVYLFIKDVAETCDPDDVIIVTSSLTKDMTCDVDLYRANALRVLARIVDAAMLGAIERYVKQAVVDSSGQVSSAALVSATHLFERNSESEAIVKRWISETTEATSSPNEMVQVSFIFIFLGLGMVEKIRGGLLYYIVGVWAINYYICGMRGLVDAGGIYGGRGVIICCIHHTLLLLEVVVLENRRGIKG